MPILCHSKSRSRIHLLSPQSPDLTAGPKVTNIYDTADHRFSAQLLGPPHLTQVYSSAAHEVNEVCTDEETELFALHWNGLDSIDTVITLRELKRGVWINDKRIDLVRGHQLADGDKIEVGAPLSALEDTFGEHAYLTFKLDVVLVPPPDQMERTSYKVIGQLGKGAYGKVLRARDTLDGRLLAIKAVKVRREELDNALLEPYIWGELYHESICQYHRHWVDAALDQGGAWDASIYIVIDYAPYGSLTHFINLERGPPHDSVNRNISRQICEAFKYLHDRGIAHCDLKPNNVVIKRIDLDGNPEKIAIIDFGLALRDGHLHELREAVEWYRAPEIGLRDRRAITLLVDSFAIAATIFSFVTNGNDLVELPKWQEKKLALRGRLNASEANRSRRLRLDDLDSYDKHLKDFITRLSLNDPLKRMSPKDALSHLWLQPWLIPETEDESSGHIEEVDADSNEPEPEPANAKRTRSQRSAGGLSSEGRYDKRMWPDDDEIPM